MFPGRKTVGRGVVVDGGSSRSAVSRVQRRPVAQGRNTNSSRKGPPRSVGAEGGTVDLLVELLSCYLFLPPSAPLVAFGCGNSRWSIWTQAQATKALRQVVSVAGVKAEEYALHSLRIGGATHLSAGGADPEVLKREGRWASGA